MGFVSKILFKDLHDIFPSSQTLDMLKKGLWILKRTNKLPLESHRCFLKWWYPRNTPKWAFLIGKPMVVGETHHFRKPPTYRKSLTSWEPSVFEKKYPHLRMDIFKSQNLWVSTRWFEKTISGWWFQTFFYFHPYFGKWSNLTLIFQIGWNHQLDNNVFLPDPWIMLCLSPIRLICIWYVEKKASTEEKDHLPKNSFLPLYTLEN